MPINKITKTTNGISIVVETKFREQFSDPEKNYYYFSYFITIINHSDFDVKLLFRTWHITDSNGEHRMVEGPGVVGLQPEIASGKSFSYESGCNFVSDMGQMKGQYLVQRLLDKQNLEIEIPEFVMEVPWRLN